MLNFAGNLRVFVALEPCDMRKSFNGQHALVAEKLDEDPMQSALFAFTSKSRTRTSAPLQDELSRRPSARQLGS